MVIVDLLRQWRNLELDINRLVTRSSPLALSSLVKDEPMKCSPADDQRRSIHSHSSQPYWANCYKPPSSDPQSHPFQPQLRPPQDNFQVGPSRFCLFNVVRERPVADDWSLNRYPHQVTSPIGRCFTGTQVGFVSAHYRVHLTSGLFICHQGCRFVSLSRQTNPAQPVVPNCSNEFTTVIKVSQYCLDLTLSKNNLNSSLRS